jgi:hypothetical protein
MKPIRTLLVAALAAGGLVMAADASAQHHSGGHWSGGHSGGHWSGGHRAGSHWSGGHWNGGHWGGARWHGGWGPRWSFYFGVPLFWAPYYSSAPYYWGPPYYYDYDYGYYGYPYPDASYPDAAPAPSEELPQTTQVPSAQEGAPSRGPLYMNYCASAKAYFPKVTKCPEGWKFIAPD